jgi:galactoside O-acetyltransferase
MKTYGGRYLNSAELKELGCRSVGNNVAVHSTCLLVGLENISFGNHIRVDAYTSLIAGDGRINIGNHNHIAVYAFLSGAEGIDLADFVGISAGARIYTRNDDYTGEALTGPTVPERFLRVSKGAVSIGRHVVVGAGTIVLPGCSIGEGTTVGALSLVRSPLPEWGIYAGIPAKRLRDRSRALLDLEHQLLEEEAQQAARR